MGKSHSGQKVPFGCALSKGYGCGDDADGSLQVGHSMGLVRGPCLALWLVLYRKWGQNIGKPLVTDQVQSTGGWLLQK